MLRETAAAMARVRATEPSRSRGCCSNGLHSSAGESPDPWIDRALRGTNVDVAVGICQFLHWLITAACPEVLHQVHGHASRVPGVGEVLLGPLWTLLCALGFWVTEE